MLNIKFVGESRGINKTSKYITFGMGFKVRIPNPCGASSGGCSLRPRVFCSSGRGQVRTISRW